MKYQRADRLALLALLAVLAITVVWWALALWPVRATPEWLLRTRVACFGTDERGLPDISGWLVLIGQPIGMVAVLFVMWRRSLVSELTRLMASAHGRASLGFCVLLLVVGMSLTAVRVRTAAAHVIPDGDTFTSERLDRQAPPFALLNQSGDTIRLERFRGRPVLLTFAYAHCETLCPLQVHEVLAAQHQVALARSLVVPAVVVVTLDPWRDTPARLPVIARQWRLGEDAHVLSGGTNQVLSVLEDWEVSYLRDERTGEITHPARVYVIDSRGRITFAVSGNAGAIVSALSNL